MSDDRTKADKAWEARQEAARYRIFNAATNATEATDEGVWNYLARNSSGSLAIFAAILRALSRLGSLATHPGPPKKNEITHILFRLTKQYGNLRLDGGGKRRGGTRFTQATPGVLDTLRREGDSTAMHRLMLLRSATPRPSAPNPASATATAN
jgi:hypothetical protein